MSHQEPPTPETTTPYTPLQDEPQTAPYTSVQDDSEWIEDEELPRRPRRRLLTPLPLSLLGILLIACGFIGGVLVEKGESSSSTSPGTSSALASRFAALRGGTAGSTGTRAGATTGSSTGSSAAGGFTRPTAGTVAYLAGNTLYVTNSEGNTVKVTTGAGTSVTKTVKSTTKGIHPGEAVTIVGATASSGSITAESISVGASTGGLAGLFGGGGAAASRGGSTGGSSSSSSGGQSLFGN
jgi:hypothetical protein